MNCGAGADPNASVNGCIRENPHSTFDFASRADDYVGMYLNVQSYVRGFVDKCGWMNKSIDLFNRMKQPQSPCICKICILCPQDGQIIAVDGHTFIQKNCGSFCFL